MISSLELARLCGVSQGTVDRALHDRPGVSAATRQRVLEMAEQHGYRPNPAAREILTGSSRVVSAIVPTVNNVFFMDIFAEIARSLAERDLRLQLTPVSTREAFLDTLEDFAARRHRLALVIPPEEGIVIPEPVTRRLPVVSLFSSCDGREVRFLSGDEVKTGHDAVRYLHGKGHRRILHVTYTRDAAAIAARAKGYEAAMKNLGETPHILKGVERESLRQTLEQTRPTAIFCHNDWLAMSLLLLLSELGIRVPEDISVVGVDNSPTLAAMHPELTTMAFPTAALVSAITEILDGKPGVFRGGYHIVERRTVAVI